MRVAVVGAPASWGGIRSRRWNGRDTKSSWWPAREAWTSPPGRDSTGRWPGSNRWSTPRTRRPRTLPRRGSSSAPRQSTSGKRAAGGCGHHVVLSIVGVDRVEGNAHYAGKRRQEELALAGPVPATVLRATQFHEFAEMVVCWTRRGGRDRAAAPGAAGGGVRRRAGTRADRDRPATGSCARSCRTRTPGPGRYGPAVVGGARRIGPVGPELAGRSLRCRDGGGGPLAGTGLAARADGLRRLAREEMMCGVWQNRSPLKGPTGKVFECHPNLWSVWTDSRRRRSLRSIRDRRHSPSPREAETSVVYGLVLCLAQPIEAKSGVA